ncbi:MAG: CPBP family intramembrane metalloprotease [Deltaproteobacteria bacterium]|nr:CPBP family intramembrane metalloprotease [Deltaproteobacteria bacterium]
MWDAKETAGLHAEPQPPALGPRRFVAVAALFYGTLLAAAIGWRAWADGVGPWRSGGPPLAEMGLFARLAVGLAFGALLIALSRVWTARSAAGRALAAELGAVVAGISTWQAVLLALLSGIGEEAFFRGALQPEVGWLWASLLFGLAHFHPRRELRVWSLAAALAGLGFGALFDATGDLVAPAAAHALVNAVNLRWLARRGTARP